MKITVTREQVADALYEIDMNLLNDAKYGIIGDDEAEKTAIRSELDGMMGTFRAIAINFLEVTEMVKETLRTEEYSFIEYADYLNMLTVPVNEEMVKVQWFEHDKMKYKVVPKNEAVAFMEKITASGSEIVGVDRV